MWGGALDVIRRRDAEIEASFRALTDRIPFHTIVALGPHVQAIASDREVGDAEAGLAEALKAYPDIELNAQQMPLIIARVDDLHRTYWSPSGVSDLQLPVLAPVIPAALAAAAREVSEEALLESVRRAAHLTHVDAEAIAAGNFVALLLKDLLSGGDSYGRGLLVGALAGLIWGEGGDTGIPSAWSFATKGGGIRKRCAGPTSAVVRPDGTLQCFQP